MASCALVVNKDQTVSITNRTMLVDTKSKAANAKTWYPLHRLERVRLITRPNSRVFLYFVISAILAFIIFSGTCLTFKKISTYEIVLPALYISGGAFFLTFLFLLDVFGSGREQTLIFAFGTEMIKLNCDPSNRVNMERDVEDFITYLESRVQRSRRSQTPQIGY